MNVWYPSAHVRLQVRPQQLAESPTPTPHPPYVTASMVDEVAASEFLPWNYAIVPLRMTVERNSFRQCDTARITLNHARCPLDPRALRAASVTVYAGTIDPVAFSLGQGPLGGRGDTTLVEETPENLIFTGFVDECSIVFSEDNNTITFECRDLTSVLEDAQINQHSFARIPAATPIDVALQMIISGEPNASGVDVRVAQTLNDLRDQSVNRKSPARRLTRRHAAISSKLTKTIASLASTPPSKLPAVNALISSLTQQQVETAAQLAKEQTRAATVTPANASPRRLGIPGASTVKVVNRTGVPLPPIGQLASVGTDSAGNAKRKAKKRDDGTMESAWQMIADIIVESGHIPAMRHNELGVTVLEIHRPRTFYADVTPLPLLPTFLMGLNCDEIEISRAYAGRPTISCVKLVAENVLGEPIIAYYPPLAVAKARATAKPNGGSLQITPILTSQRIGGPNPVPVLERQAELVYTQLNAAETRARVTTEALSVVAPHTSPDMLRLVPGDSAALGAAMAQHVAPGNPLVTQYGEHVAAEAGDKTVRLTATGMPPALATAVVEATEGIDTVLRVESVRVDFDGETGFRFDVELINYLSVL